MSCETTSPRLTIVKQTYGRINKTKKASNVGHSCHSRSSAGRSGTLGEIAVKEEPVECPTMPTNHVTDNKVLSSKQNTSLTSTSASLHDVLNAIPISADQPQPSKKAVKQASLLQFTSPRTQPPKSLALTPPRSVPNILRRTPVKQGSASRKPTTPKSKSVNLSPILYSPKVKTKNPFINDGTSAGSLPEQAHIITSFMKTPPQNKRTSPKKKSMGSQCNINVPRIMSLPPDSPKKTGCSSPKKQRLFPNSDGEKVLCNVEVKSEEMMIVSHTVNGRVYSGILVADSHRCHLAAQLNSGGYMSEQLPSQYHKKLKAKLGLSFESGCESENSDNECTKNKLQKLKYSDYKAMKDSVAVSSADNLSPAEPAFSSHSEPSPATTPKSRQNVPYQSAVNHNKKSINGLSEFLQEAASSSNSVASSKTKDNVGKSKEPSGKSKEAVSKSKESIKSKETSNKETPEKKKASKQSLVKDPAKGTKLHQPKSSPCSPKKQKMNKAKIITETLTDEIKSTINKKPKLKFGEKFVSKISPSKNSASCKEYIPTEDPATIEKKLAEVSRHFRMRTHSLDDNKALSSALAENSAKLTYVDLEWPAWCPRKLKLEIAPVRRGRPARFKLEKNGSKRRRTESNESESEEAKKDELYTENHNPFGIGDVVIAKYTPGPGRPYWPGKVLSATGLTVCVLFYNTCDVMQIAKCNVEWFYDGCKEHKISLNPPNASKSGVVHTRTDKQTPRQTRSESLSQEWKEALEEAERDVKSCIGRESIVWGLYETEWWPARVLDVDQETYTIEWLDDNSLELLPLDSLTPFLLSYNVKYSEQCAQEYDTYQAVVDQAHSLALTVLLETETVLRESSECSVKHLKIT